MAAISYSCNANGTVCQGTSIVDQTSFQRLQELLNQLAQRLGIRDRVVADGVLGDKTMVLLQQIALEVPRLPLSGCWTHSVRDIARDAAQLTAAAQLELSVPAPGGRPPAAEAPHVGHQIVYAPPAPFAPNGGGGGGGAVAPDMQTSATPGFVPAKAGPYLAAIFGVLALGGVAVFALRKKRKNAAPPMAGVGDDYVVRYTVPDEPRFRSVFQTRRTHEMFKQDAEREARRLREEGARDVRVISWSRRHDDELAGTQPLIDTVRMGDRVTIVDRFGHERTGRAVMKGPAGWVLNMGGKHGTPGIASDENTVKVRAGRR